MPATAVATVTAASKKACRKNEETILQVIVFAFYEHQIRVVR
jgi:hypothetical protein